MEIEIIYQNTTYKRNVYASDTFLSLVEKILSIIDAHPENLSLWLGDKVIGFDIPLNQFLEQRIQDFDKNNNQITVEEDFNPLSHQKIKFLLSLNEQINSIHSNILKQSLFEVPFWNKYQTCPINGRQLGSYKDITTKENFSLDILDNNFNNLVSIIKDNKRVVLNKHALKQFLKEKNCMPTILNNLNTSEMLFVMKKINVFNDFVFIDVDSFFSINFSNQLIHKLVPEKEKTFSFLKFEELENDKIINEKVICMTEDKLIDYILEKKPKFKPIVKQFLKNQYIDNNLLEILEDGIFSNDKLYRFKKIKMDFFI